MSGFRRLMMLLLGLVVVSGLNPRIETLAAPRQDGGPFFHKVYSASSSDGLNWTPDNRVLLDHASVPCAIVTPEGYIRLYYVDASTIPENVNCAESRDGGQSFTVLGCTITGRSNDKAVDPSILLLKDGRYRLFYYASLQRVDSLDPHDICSAISSDGVHFTQEQKSFAYPGLVDPDVFKGRKEWLMFVFSLKDGKTVVAQSRDGLDFKYIGPLSIQGFGTTAPLRIGNGLFRMYAFPQGSQRTFVSFTSSDGLTWTQEPGVRLTANPGEQITDPFVVKLKDGSWKMFYKVSRDTRP